MDHPPVELRATPESLLALMKGVTAFRVEPLGAATDDVVAVWLQADQLYRVSVAILDLAPQFEVFTLVVETQAQMLALTRARAPLWPSLAEPAPAGALADWPFSSWRLDVLRRMEFSVRPEHLPPTRDEISNYFDSLPAGVAPEGSHQTCLTAIGLLFRSDDGRRLLIVADGNPGWLRVTEDETLVQSYLRECLASPAAEYASTLPS